MNENNRWEPTKEQKEKFIPMIKEFMKKAEENPDTKEYIDFYNQGISPAQLKNILINDLGFEDAEFGSNDWKMAFRIALLKDGKEYMIVGTGMTFEMFFRLA